MTEKMPLRTVVGFYAAELFKSVMQSRAFLQKSLKKVNEISIEHYNFDKKCDFEANVMAFYLTHTILFECGNYKTKFLDEYWAFLKEVDDSGTSIVSAKILNNLVGLFYDVYLPSCTNSNEIETLFCKQILIGNNGDKPNWDGLYDMNRKVFIGAFSLRTPIGCIRSLLQKCEFI